MKILSQKLQGDKNNQFAVDVSKNYRLIFNGYDSFEQLSLIRLLPKLNFEIDNTAN
ncbi:hypothetical protein Hs30E_18410 [Lactococcus hodotermopsidis]|uniref:Uncharacterized protein n=1 Tax=Pseudolactococcus hodotermopsidis TaxID=2709157 RepID=A0A6A0BCZ1_9LACT|nr:hypothetical protein Hs30E_18410 [Lactococcus hodotermopsidis]